MCVLLRNYEALDFLESQAGRVAFKLPEPDITLERELVAVSHLIREVGEALESVAETLADGIVEESELRITIPKLEAVIQECASLKYLLEDLSKREKGKRKISSKKTIAGFRSLETPQSTKDFPAYQSQSCASDPNL
jgi:hypothetical protein